MACTSNQSSSCGWEYDVFLSFRGEDTRKSFVSHVRSALKRSGIRTFIDDEQLPNGEDISPKLREAIHNSRVCVIVFSQNYVSSSWCLKELVEILKCKRICKSQVVIPLYYDVQPSVLRHLDGTGSYADALRKHSTRHGLQEVQIWRAALKEAADLKGHVLANEDNGDEAKFIEKIVGEVQKIVCSVVMEPLIESSIDSNRDSINRILSIGSDDVRIIGIYGMGGIGKSTISKAVYYDHVKKFECGAVVENIKDVSKQVDGILRLQERLLCQLEEKDVKLNATDEGTDRIRRICQSRKVLILLDDFDNLNQISKLAGSKSWLCGGSRMIVVTRDAKLLKEAQVLHTHEMKVLNEEESLKLFTKNAIKEEETPSKDQISLSKDIVRYCEGLPLALEVIGGYLRGEDLEFWRNALKEFQSKPHKDVYDRLKISYDALSKDRKSVFLDAACFFIGRKMDYLIQFWGGCGFAENSVRELIDKCLFKIDEEECLWMHDHLRDMGRQIVHETSEGSLEKQSRLWNPEEVYDLLSSQIKEKVAVEGICLDFWKLETITLEAKAFESMHKLRFLEINGPFEVRGRFDNVFRQLRWLSWKNCWLDNLPLGFLPTKLIILEIQNNRIKKLWEGVKHLSHLKILDLTLSRLLETPDFMGTPSLERLILTGCYNLKFMNDFTGCYNFKRIHHLTGSEFLNDFTGCYNFKRIHHLTGSEFLNVFTGCYNFKRIHHLTGSELLNVFTGCYNFKRIHPSICHLKSLQTLDLRGFSELECLPEELGNLECLLKLNLSWCKKLSCLPASTCNLLSLQKLDLHRCSNLKELPEELGNLESLLELNLSGCMKLSCLPTSTCNLLSLRKLDPTWCSNLKELPEELGNLKCLLELNLSWCKKLSCLPASTCNLLSLQKLNLYMCSNLKELPEELGNLESLLELNLSGCKKLSCLPTSTCNLLSLRKLDLTWCSNLKELPEELGNLECLLEMNLSVWEALMSSGKHLQFIITTKNESQLVLKSERIAGGIR